jgi:hypothetical protein
MAPANSQAGRWDDPMDAKESIGAFPAGMASGAWFQQGKIPTEYQFLIYQLDSLMGLEPA